MLQCFITSDQIFPDQSSLVITRTKKNNYYEGGFINVPHKYKKAVEKMFYDLQTFFVDF